MSRPPGRIVIGFPNENDRRTIHLDGWSGRSCLLGYVRRVQVNSQDRFFAEGPRMEPIEGTFKTRVEAAEVVVEEFYR